ncbi:MAG: DUF2971 domain-containing protein [Proteobacteria bacterium]|nr:DUF2971 domain-containing protein [Pseudomonadota bacterium]
MNDYSEMHWAYEKFIEAGNMVLDKIGHEFLDKVDQIVSEGQLRVLPLICAFSTDGDVLSQWRAYADDGAGVALGLNAAKVATLSTRIASIEYTEKKQLSHFQAFLLALHEVLPTVPERDQEQFFFDECAQLSIDMCLFKNPAFSEEKEVRLVRALNVKREGKNWRLTDNGGSGERKSKKRSLIKFRSSAKGGVIAYIELPLDGLGKDIISEVIIGPRSINNGIEISMALTAAGFRNFTIRQSTATYR